MMSLYYNPEYREKVTWDKYLYSTFMPWFNRGQPVAAAPTVAV
jgi:hypothetical protein